MDPLRNCSAIVLLSKMRESWVDPGQRATMLVINALLSQTA